MFVAEDVLQEEEVGDELRQRNGLADDGVRHPAGDDVTRHRQPDRAEIRHAKPVIALDDEAAQLREIPILPAHAERHDVAADGKNTCVARALISSQSSASPINGAAHSRSGG